MSLCLSSAVNRYLLLFLPLLWQRRCTYLWPKPWRSEEVPSRRRRSGRSWARALTASRNSFTKVWEHGGISGQRRSICQRNKKHSCFDSELFLKRTPSKVTSIYIPQISVEVFINSNCEVSLLLVPHFATSRFPLPWVFQALSGIQLLEELFWDLFFLFCLRERAMIPLKQQER